MSGTSKKSNDPFISAQALSAEYMRTKSVNFPQFLGLMNFDQYPRFEDVNRLAMRVLQSRARSALNPNPGMLSYYVENQRIPYLGDRTFSFSIEARTEKVDGVEINIPDNVVIVKHKRACHPCVRQREKRDNNGKDYHVSRLGKITINKLNIVNGDFSSLLSTFNISCLQPEEWDLSLRAFESWCRFEKKAYLDKRTKKLIAVYKLSDHVKILEDVLQDDIAFVNKNIHVLLPAYSMARFNSIMREEVVSRIIQAYESILGIDFDLRIYRKGIKFGMDSYGRILDFKNVKEFPNLEIYDILNSKIYKAETPPLNEKFHLDLEERLRNPLQLSENQRRVNLLLNRSYCLLADDHTGSAIERASTAFQLELADFLIQQEIITEEDYKLQRYRLREMCSGLFDQAAGKIIGTVKTNSFDLELKDRLIKTRKFKPNIVAPVYMTRNAETHHGTDVHGQESGYLMAIYCVAVFVEGVHYIRNQGWNKRRVYPSLMRAFMHNQVKVPFDPLEVHKMIDQEYKRFKQYEQK